MRKLINARTRKNKCSAHMLTNARQDYSIPLIAIRLSMLMEYIGFFFFQKLLYWKMKNNNSDAEQIESSQQAMSHCNEEFYPN